MFLQYDRGRIASTVTQQGTSFRAPDAPAPVAFCDEGERANVLAAYGIGTLDDDPQLASIAEFAARLCEAPVALISVVEAERQRFIARAGLDTRETPRSQSFCAHAMLGTETMVVPDAATDPLFADNELVTGPPHVRFYAGAPLVSREGIPLGALCVIDTKPRPAGLTELQLHGLEVLAQTVMQRLRSHRARLAAEKRSLEGARAMREIADMVPAIVWSADDEGNFDYFNGRWELTTGTPKPATLRDWRAHVHPDDAERTLKAWETSFAGGHAFESEYRLKQADGEWRWTLARALPVHDAQGKLVRWYGTLTDIHEGHSRSESRDLLARELSHRIKNIFAVVSGLVSLRARRVPEASEFAAELIAAIGALGRAHDFVRPVEGAKGDNLRGLLAELMAPYEDEGGRVVIRGDDCPIGPRAATPLALTFHELATNSAKYGAFSAEGGSVSIVIDCPENGDTANIAWRERGGPATDHPVREGFGSRLVRSSIEGQLGGTIAHRFAPDGLEVDISVPLGAIRS
jgi:PAS domain S-box-containing protein